MEELTFTKELSVIKTIVINPHLIEEIDAIAKSKGVSRSRLVSVVLDAWIRENKKAV